MERKKVNVTEKDTNSHSGKKVQSKFFAQSMNLNFGTRTECSTISELSNEQLKTIFAVYVLTHA